MDPMTLALIAGGSGLLSGIGSLFSKPEPVLHKYLRELQTQAKGVFGQQKENVNLAAAEGIRSTQDALFNQLISNKRLASQQASDIMAAGGRGFEDVAGDAELRARTLLTAIAPNEWAARNAAANQLSNLQASRYQNLNSILGGELSFNAQLIPQLAKAEEEAQGVPIGAMLASLLGSAGGAFTKGYGVAGSVGGTAGKA